MKRLILTTVPDDFDPDRDVPLGPWCFLGKENLYSGWEELPFPDDPFPTESDFAQASRLTSNSANGLIPRLAKSLNDVNRSYYSEKFWRIILLPWLLMLIQSVWEHENRIRQFFHTHTDTDFRVDILPADIPWKFKDSLDFIYRGILNPVFNEWIYSRVIEQCAPENCVVDYRSDRIDPGLPVTILKERNKFFKQRFLDNRCIGVYGVRAGYSFMFSLFLRLVPVRNNGALDAGDENVHADGALFQTDIESLLWPAMPTCHMDLSQVDIKRPVIKKGRIRLVGPNIFYNESLKCYLALCVEGGEKIICTQHGGFAGRGKVQPSPAEVEYKQYAFFSWGWQKQEDYPGNIVALPSPYLTAYRNKHREIDSKLVFVGGVGYIFQIRLTTALRPLQNLEFRHLKIEFLRSLDPGVYPALEYRPIYNEDGKLKDREYVEARFPGIRILSGDLHARILSCRLLVLDHPTSTLTIALVANIPTIGFWKKAHWPLARQAVPVMEALQDAGIFFTSGVDAARKVNDIWPNVCQWWNQRHIQEVREQFCRDYANTSRFWWLSWLKALWRI
jgi:hypothetical protein